MVLNSPLAYWKTPVELRVYQFKHFVLLKIPWAVSQVVYVISLCKHRHWILDGGYIKDQVSILVRCNSVFDDSLHLLPNTKNLTELRFEPEEYGWEQRLGKLLPSKCIKLLPPEMSIICKCAGKCDTTRCGCISAWRSCGTFYHGKFFSVSCMNHNWRKYQC